MAKFTGNILALDLATTTGWAYGRPGGKPNSGAVRFSKPGAGRAETYRAFLVWLTRFVAMTPCALITYESPAQPLLMMGRTNIDTIKRLIGMAENLEEWAHERIELREASVQQVRAHFIGSNRHKRDDAKRLTIQRCRDLGWDVDGDDAADACALWSYQVCCLRPDVAAKMTVLGRVISEW